MYVYAQKIRYQSIIFCLIILAIYLFQLSIIFSYFNCQLYLVILIVNNNFISFNKPKYFSTHMITYKK